MDIHLNVLIIEDSEDDAILLLRELRKGGFNPEHKRVESSRAMKAALEEKDWDIIISDYSMPSFTGLEALEIYNEKGLKIPFILVSGTIGEELAVEAMRKGAHDYIMKDNLTRLVPAVNRELKEANTRRHHRKTRENLRQSEERYHSLISNIPSVTWITNNKGETTFISPNIERLYGYTAGEIYDAGERLWFKRIHPEDVEKVKNAYVNLFKKEHQFDIQYRIQRKDGQWIWLHDRAMTTYEKKGILYAYGVFSDITEHKKSELDLSESERRFRETLTNLNMIAVQLDNEGNITFANNYLLDLSGWNENEIIGKNWMDIFIDDENKATVKKIHKNNMQKGQITNVENDIVCKDGQKRLIKWNNSRLLDSENNIIGMTSIGEDVTEINRINQALIQSETKFRALFENMNEGFAYHKILVDENNRPVDYVFLLVNGAFENATGLKKDIIIGKKITELIPGIRDASPDLITLYGEVAQAGKNSHFELYFKPFNKWYFVHAYSPHKDHFVTIFTEITERKQAEEELNKHRDHLEEMVKERTKDLEEKTKDLENFNKLFVEREFRIKELKDRIKELKGQN